MTWWESFVVRHFLMRYLDRQLQRWCGLRLCPMRPDVFFKIKNLFGGN